MLLTRATPEIALAPTEKASSLRLPPELSAGSFASRLCWLGAKCFVAASGSETYALQVSSKLQGVSQVADRDYEAFSESAQRTEVVLLPNRQTSAVWSVLAQPRFRTEAQCLASSLVDGDLDGDRQCLVACVDSLGALAVSRLHLTECSSGTQIQNRSSFTGATVEHPRVHPGPSCCALARPGRSKSVRSPYIAVAGYLGCTVSVYEGELLVRHMRTLEHPSSLTFGSGSGAFGAQFHSTPCEHEELLYFTEGPAISLCDLRAPGMSFRRKIIGGHASMSSGATVSWYSCDLVGYEMALVGPQRCVLVVDVRRWGVLGRWWSCLKYDATTVMWASATSPSLDRRRTQGMLLYVSGRDNEMACGTLSATAPETQPQQATHEQGRRPNALSSSREPVSAPCGWQQKGERLFGFRAENGWIGAARYGECGWAGLTERGILYTLRTWSGKEL
ncbi:hypothetical protein CYME_CMT331C [Cyanidioschyzon merolae strain 10D]|uniref:Uncharacterized protein n=1 Tax=Cyanidioschyzon merolae (strain NIES-3377 / 10D) TaxID=280699 RepID=M1VIC0_CYAM1|nr:hypothetical protein CYME_CMT331C [Cyanidioschyzon merolae strain 10D]BAM83292.1 hypothetical protein CYME_CMT331C [Cyanidioschyzon merolae strain 10D]|eukprot:XP_005539328.1 hypothetical protein CYME_CMT331C [Cyanidioschyzon merolae strain 10D]